MRYLGYTLGDPSAPLAPPTPELMEEMGKFVEEATKAGVLLATGGLAPYSGAPRGIRSGGEVTAGHGAFPEAKELSGGLALVEGPDKGRADEGGHPLLVPARA